jgi:hypothetical protein
VAQAVTSLDRDAVWDHTTPSDVGDGIFLVRPWDYQALLARGQPGCRPCKFGW